MSALPIPTSGLVFSLRPTKIPNCAKNRTLLRFVPSAPVPPSVLEWIVPDCLQSVPCPPRPLQGSSASQEQGSSMNTLQLMGSSCWKIVLKPILFTLEKENKGHWSQVTLV